MLRTLLRMKRDVRRFAPRIAFDHQAADLPTLEEARRYGEIMLLEDIVAVLNPDGTISEHQHTVSMLAGDDQLAQWDEVPVFYNTQLSKMRVETAKVYPPGGPP